ncbi:bacteriohopanetetrol glucosamine biosynthesis glycosyltransferase HpnI [Sphingomonas sp.]|uniref:bacteriohopanetetrol glucosamine biosynthesis glycosyltransferase HpnI n=1 Tax=Sphingomonas sp. TaxID=28214 RepID=UPI001DE29E78|nr:bacteriohopanetetrol glucosamine biosynthesis glycosyltransferase HpnI [Sphingomonas sp.]MBX9795586.1 bacteriohopanetetrol glucosamine biosynthesis glycosyltransferase HpnI [Sphingomonas sp.]
MIWVGIFASALALLGACLVLLAAVAVWRFGRSLSEPVAAPAEAVTLLKPLHGDEPRLVDNLATFLDQQWAAPIQLVAGVQRADDPAIAAVAKLKQARPDAAITLVSNAARHGANAKIGNLVNMSVAIRHRLVVLSDSDMVAPPDYLTRVVAALARPGVGAVSCTYAGRGDAGFWSRFGAAGLSYHFLPSVLLSVMLGAGDACMGSTIAMRRETLDRIGGFDRFADILADDYAIGAALREAGMTIAVAPVIVTHGSMEASFGELWRHELRWLATVRDLKPAGHLGATLLHPLPMALVAAALAPAPLGIGALVAVLGARLANAMLVDRVVGRSTAPLWLLPARDLMSFAVHVTSFFVRRVDWRGERLAMREAGRIEAQA